jgi:beta-phosphoglucomutase
LTNTAEFHYLAWKRLAEEMGWRFDRVVNERLKGVSRLESLEIVLEHAGVELPTAEKVELTHRKNEYFGELIRTIEPGQLLPGIAELLHRLREGGVRTAVASVSHNVWEIVSRLGITDSVDAIVDPAALLKGKPDPEAFFKAADMLGVPYEDCAAIEDAQVGVQAIKSARMLAVGIGSELVGADWRLDRTDQLTYDGLLQNFAAHNSAPAARDGEGAVSEG